MSGVEALAGIGILCNAMQIVTFGRDVLVTYKSIKDNHSPDARLLHASKDVNALYETMIKDVSTVPRPLEQDEQRLVNATEECVVQITELIRMVEKLSVPPGTSRHRQKVSTVTRSLAFMWRKSDVDAMEKSVDRYQKLVDTHLLQHISRHVKSSGRDAQGAFAELHDQVKQVLVAYKTENGPIRDFISSEARGIQSCIAATGADLAMHVDRQLAITERGIQTHVSDTVQNSFNAEREKKDREERHERLLESLTFPERNARWNQVQSNHPSTFKWILEDESSPLVPWLQSESKLFWIAGKPASGKSTLMKYIITSPKTQKHLSHWHSDVQVIHHFFYKPGGGMQNSIEGMLCSLLCQVLDCEQSTINSDTLFHAMAKKRSYHDWSRDELSQTLIHLLRPAVNNSFCIFLDGLDEVVEELQHNNMRMLLNELRKLDNVKICASSREEPSLIHYFSGTEKIRMQDLTRKDIKDLIENHLSKANIPADSCEKLVKAIVFKADGVFMWVILVLNSVIRGFESDESDDECMKRINAMPSSLHDLYKEMWTRSEVDGIDHTTAILYFDLIIKRSRLNSEFSLVNLFELAVMHANEDWLDSFFDSADSEPVAQLCEKVRNRIKLKCAGLLDCTSDGRYTYARDSTYQSLLVFAKTTVDFTHRTVFDFLTDSKEGRQIIAKSSLTDKDCYVQSLKAMMIERRVFQNWGSTSGSAIDEIFCFCRANEIYQPKMAEITDDIMEHILNWQTQGFFPALTWEKEHHSILSWPNGRRQVYLLQLILCSITTHRRLASELIRRLRHVDFLYALQGIFFGVLDYFSEDYKTIIHQTVSRVAQIQQSNNHEASQGIATTYTMSLAFSSLLHAAVSDEYVGPSHQTDQSLFSSELTRMIRDFEKLQSFQSFWNEAYIQVLTLDFVGRSILWDSSTEGLEVAVVCNYKFLKDYLVQKARIKSSEEFSGEKCCSPFFKVLLVDIRGHTLRNHPNHIPNIAGFWQRPMTAITERMEEILVPSLLHGKPFSLIEEELRSLCLSALDSPHESIRGQDIRYCQNYMMARLKEEGYRLHPWEPNLLHQIGITGSTPCEVIYDTVSDSSSNEEEYNLEYSHATLDGP